MNQEKIDAFMAELKQLSDKYGIGFREEGYDGAIYLVDPATDEDISYSVNIEEFRATLYKPKPAEPPIFGPITAEVARTQKMMNALKNDYMTGFAEHFNTPTILEQIRDAKGKGKPVMMRFGRMEE